MKLGARIFKTGLAVVLALFLATILQFPSPVFAGISAVFAIQPSVYRSYLTVIEQIQGNIIGAIIAFIFVTLFGNDFLIVGLAAIVLIMINISLKNENTISLSLVTLIVIMETPSDEFFTFAILRFATIMLGILSAFVINMTFLPPKYEKKLYDAVSDLTGNIVKWIRINNQRATRQLLLKKEINSFKEQLLKIEQLFLFYKEDRPLLRRTTKTKMRKLVVYRQMIAAAKVALELLINLHRFDRTWREMPPEISSQFYEKIEKLNGNHEHLMLRMLGKTIQNHEEEMREYEDIRKDLLRIFQEYRDVQMDEIYLSDVLQCISSIIEYNVQLERLEVYLNSYLSGSKNEEP